MKKRNNIHVLIDIFAPKDGLETYRNMREKYSSKQAIAWLKERVSQFTALKAIRRNWPVNTK